MAKGARASTIKSNNAKLKANVFGPVETARTERLSARLLELASAPKPAREEPVMKDVEEDVAGDSAEDGKPTETMDLDSNTTQAAPKLSKTQIKHRIEKRKSSKSKSSIVFPKYKNGKKIGATTKKR